MSKDAINKNAVNRGLFDKEPVSFNNPERKTLDETDVGNVGMAVLTLTQELWVLRDRIHIIEAVLAKKGIDIQDDIENFQPDETLQNALNEQGQVLIAKVLKALKGL